MRALSKWLAPAIALSWGCGIEIVDSGDEVGETGSSSESSDSGSESGSSSELDSDSESDSGSESDSSSNTSSESDSSSDSESSSESDSGPGCPAGELGCPCGLAESCTIDLFCSAGICAPILCGDGEIAGAEECDDGNAIDSDGCNADCTPTQVIAIDAGGDFTCVLLDSGDVKCWGRGNFGQLGQANTNIIGDAETPATIPVIELGAKATAIAAGGDHACALLASDDVVCWGYGQYGRLGYANTLNIGDDEVPALAGVVQVGGEVEKISLGEYSTCAILVSGYGTCWGQGGSYQLGTGNTNNIGDDEHPGSVGVLSAGDELDFLAAGQSHTCGLREDASGRCWGSGSSGKLGYASVNSIASAMSAGALSLGGPIMAMGAGTEHTCALLASKQLMCWGLGAYGALGYGNTLAIGDTELPGPALALAPIIAITLGRYHTCALFETGKVGCWGDGQYGKLGYGNVTTIGDNELPSTAGTVNLGGNAIAISAGRNHTCALLDTHEVMCWGQGQYGALGYANPEDVGDNEAPFLAGTVEVF